MTLPNLHSSFRQRFDVAGDGSLHPPNNVPPQDNPTLMRAFLPREQRRVHALSDVAKLTPAGDVINKWDYELPPMAIVGVMQSVYHTNGVGTNEMFPFALKAVGRVNAVQILLRRGKFVSDHVEIVP